MLRLCFKEYLGLCLEETMLSMQATGVKIKRPCQVSPPILIPLYRQWTLHKVWVRDSWVCGCFWRQVEDSMEELCPFTLPALCISSSGAFIKPFQQISARVTRSLMSTSRKFNVETSSQTEAQEQHPRPCNLHQKWRMQSWPWYPWP